jgi:hypothetical protein
MNRWTDSAKAKVEQYFTGMRQSLTTSGADAEEVIEDLRRHIEEEAAARQLTVVTEQDVGQILARIGAPEGVTTVAEPPRAASTTNNGTAEKKRKLPGWWLLIFGVILPFGTIVFEFFSGACAGLFIDLLPTLTHALLATLVPAANLWAWLAVRNGSTRWRNWLGWANGAAIGISLVFALVLLPLAPYALISLIIIVGLLFYGIGLAPLAPLFSFISALILRRHLRESQPDGSPLKGLWPGIVVGAGVLVLVTVPLIIANVGLQMAISEDPAESTRGVRLLRAWGQDEDLLRACYGRGGRSGEMYSWGKPVSPEAARFIYYRVHGQPFNAVPPPALYAGRGRWDVMEEQFTWDNDQAGDAVAGRVKGLSLVHSRQDAVLDPDAALAYVEWTLEFKNDSALQRESRAELVLPPGGVVSRLTLWIDGQEREAAFGGRSQVKTAYKEVVERRRDPVLVSTCGPDRVLVQCFPVQPNGGKMKVRLGITAPLALAGGDSGCLRWPVMAERNFTIGEKFHHSLWVESSAPVDTTGGRLKSEGSSNGRFALRGEVRDTDLSDAVNIVRVRRSAEAVESWTRDTRQENAPFILQTIKEQAATAPDRVVVVVDGTKGMENEYASIRGALTRLAPNVDFALLLARDGCEEIIPLQKGTIDLYSKVALWKFTSSGGHDNIPALLRAWDLAAASKAGAIVWIHGPQPVTLESTEDLRQRFERSINPPVLYDIETRVGPNRVLESLDGLKPVRTVARLGLLGDDLGRLFDTWTGRSRAFEFKRECIAAEPGAAPPPGKETSLQLARLWAAEEVGRLCEARHPDEAAQVATKHQLVTPVSGAVVLETQAQYQRAGLQPVAPESVPSVPEPSGVLLLGIGLLLLAGRVRGRRLRAI